MAVAAPPSSPTLVTAAVGTTVQTPGGQVTIGIAGASTDSAGRPVAAFAVFPAAAAGGWQTDQSLHAGQMLPIPGGQARIVSITQPSAAPVSRALGGETHGSVALTLQAAPATGNAAAPSLYLLEGGTLTLHAPEPTQQMAVRVIAWLPDAAHPHAARLEWLPSYLLAGGAQPDEIGAATLQAGSTHTIGPRTVTLLTLQGRTSEHPCWLELRLN